MSEPVVFLKGEFVPASKASIRIYDLGVVSGATFTEMTRTFAGVPFRLDDHLARLNASLDYGGITIPLTLGEMRERTLQVIQANYQLLDKGQDLAVVCFVTAGENMVYAGRADRNGPLQPTICIHSFPLAFRNWQHLFIDGAYVVTPEIRHIPSECIDSKAKHRSRLHWFLADHQTRAVEPRAFSLLLDFDGYITESTGANFLFIKEGTVFSPTDRNILQGVSLQTVREIVGELELEWVEKDLTVKDVIAADEAWLTSTPYCIAPCTRINDITIGAGNIGPLFRQVQAKWSERVGFDIEQQVLAATY